MSPTTGNPTERPLRADAERNRRRILEAGRSLFAERGLGVTLDDVAHRAGVGVGTAYRRFPDKEALIDALFEERIDELVAWAEEGLAHADPWDGLALFFERGLAAQATDRGLMELVLSPAHGRDRVALARERLRPVVDALVERARASGQLRPDVQGTDMPLIHLMLSAVVDYTRDVGPGVWRRYLTIMLDGLRAQPGTPGPLPGDALDVEQVDTAMRAWKPPPAR
jgi:AcrR family transcriptional regulator